jgi:toxin ParE1/3/4
MQTFTLASKALEDLKGIGRFTQFRWGRQQRLNYLAMLDNSFQQLAADPLIGQDASDIRRPAAHYLWWQGAGTSEH